ncbi:HLA class II histocompatibility antigen, DM beta chain-like [Osmerus eperlanus]|uniref:HLA class II histocompatibility antigen, DM beta chain-like n=1 Tax=Osmerus eperlanus TaxID=29151 RepID=UPI002E11A40B
MVDAACKNHIFRQPSLYHTYTISQRNNPDRIVNKTVEPSVHLRSETPPNSKHTTMLKCSAYRFYPKEIQVTWIRNGQDVTSDISTEDLYDGDFYFQHHSYLEYTPTPGEEVFCMVEHASLPRPKIFRWDPSMPVSERVQLGIGALGVFLGLVVLTAGSLYYKRRPIVVVRTPSTVELQSRQETNLNVNETLSQEACM